jgi:hypothetical protein
MFVVVAQPKIKIKIIADKYFILQLTIKINFFGQSGRREFLPAVRQGTLLLR